MLVAAAARGVPRRFAIVNQSMQPTLEPDDWVIAQRTRRTPARGDIVVFNHEDRPGLSLVKRVIGVPGEHVEIGAGQVHIDGLVLAEPWASGFTQPDGSWDVPHDAVWVLGDHRMAAGGDSRTLGAIPVADVGWKVVARYWPAARSGLVS